MPASATRRRNRFGDVFRSKVTYHRDVAGERKELKRQAFSDRRERLSIKKLEAAERVAAAKIAAADRKIAAAESKIAKASTKGAGRGGTSEAAFEAMKERMEREIQAQEEHKRAALAKVGNPSSWGYGIYQGAGFTTRQMAHFRSKAAAETYARSAGLKGYSIKRAFAKDRNPAMEFSTEYHLGYNLGQADRQAANLRKTLDELHASFAANFGASASWESFEQAYQAGYSGQMGAAAPNPDQPRRVVGKGIVKRAEIGGGRKKIVWEWEGQRWPKETYAGLVPLGGYGGNYGDRKTGQVVRFDSTGGTTARNPRGQVSRGSSRNPDLDPEEREAREVSEVFHGRPVQEEIIIDEEISERDKLAALGKLCYMVIKGPKGRITLRFSRNAKDTVWLMYTKTGNQFYLRGGDQEIDLKALGMAGPEWFKDLMVLGELKKYAYSTGKKFHKFAPTEYFHLSGEGLEGKVDPRIAKSTILYDTLNKRLKIAGGQYKVDMEDLVEGTSRGIVN
jgi:hypothetical protein